MPIITAVKQQKKQSRVNVYLDGNFGFGIDLENFVLSGLKIGKELSEKEINEIVKKAEFQKTFEKLLRFAMVRPRSKKEVSDWFYKKEVHESIQEELVKKLINLDLLDDKNFAIWWIEQRNSFKPRSVRLLKLELSQKGIDKEILVDIFSEREIDEFSVALKLAEKKKNLDKEKMVGFLSRKGFSWDVIEKVLRVLIGNDSIEKEW